jgi:predicted nucleotidyltransferase
MTASASGTRIVEILRAAVPDLQWAGLFGSRARGDGRPASDHDVAVLTPRPLTALRRFELAEALAIALGTDVDLIDLRSADTVLRSQVVTTARELFSAGGSDVEAFLDFVYADYARLNEERAAILRDVHQRGRIHGR